MPTWLQTIFIWLYALPSLVLAFFAINMYVLVILFKRRLTAHRKEVTDLYAAFEASGTELPLVVTQLPIYNEFNVIESCLRAVVDMQYPAGRHHIQILDDSTDETSALVDRLAAELRAEGAHIDILRRENRIGYKAGALEAAMQHTEADYFAIFDADFCPPEDFLLRAMPLLVQQPKVGLIQARWGHLNRNESLLTQAQAIAIDGHFTVEQPARAWNGLFMNFNGTAGIWKRAAIEGAGGWEHDTLTEDMDLSYRAQLAGWKPFFAWDLEAPAELPQDINAFKSQQFRWAKGSIETARKLLPRVLRAPQVSLFAKAQAIFHLTHYFMHPIILFMAFMTYPVLRFTWLQEHPLPFGMLIGVILLSTLAPASLYAVAQNALGTGSWKRLRVMPVLSIIGIGIAVSNTRAVWQAMRGKKSGFVRTPKRGENNTIRYRISMPWLAVIELCIGAYCFFTLVEYLLSKREAAVPFIFLYAMGFTGVGLLSLLEAFRVNRG